MKVRWSLPSFIFPALLLGVNVIVHAQDANPSPTVSSTATSPSNTTIVLKSRAELDQLLAQGPTILDQLTPYSRNQLLRSTEWHDGAISGFEFAVPIEELEQEQARHVYVMFGIERLFPEKFPLGAPLRYDDVNPSYESLHRGLKDVLNRDQAAVKSADIKVPWPIALAFYKKQLSSLLKPSVLASTSKGDLLILFKVVDEATLMTNSTIALRDLKRIHQELNHRGIDTRRSLDVRLLKHMLTQRDLDGARALVASRPHLSDVLVPKLFQADIAKNNDLTVMAEKKGQLQGKVLPSIKGKTQVLIIVSENCGFCRKLFADLERDKQLYALFSRAQIKFISALENGIPMSFVQNWNAKNPTLPMYMPGKEEQWKSIDVNGWPQFVFMKNGKVQSRLHGWAKDGSSRETLVHALEKAGL